MINRNLVSFAYRLKTVFLGLGLLLFSTTLVGCENTVVESPLLPEINAWDLKSLKITDRNNQILLFQRKNCVWTFGSEGQPANEAQVTALVDQILDQTYRQQIGGQKDLYTKFMVGKKSFTYRVDIGLPEGKMKTVFLGSTGGATVNHARPAEDESIYVLGSNKTPINNIDMASDFWLPTVDI